MSQILAEKLNNKENNADSNYKYIHEFKTQKEIDSLDVSKCATVLATTNSNETVIWDLKQGNQILTLQNIPELDNSFKVIKIIF